MPIRSYSFCSTFTVLRLKWIFKSAGDQSTDLSLHDNCLEVFNFRCSSQTIPVVTNPLLLVKYPSEFFMKWNSFKSERALTLHLNNKPHA